MADENTFVLDPAAGTGTFLYTAIKLINQRLVEVGRLGVWNDYVARHLLPRLFGFELLMAPYAVAHLKLGLELSSLGYEFGSDQRLGVYLTNTLEEAIRKSDVLFAHFITEEANAAARIKAEEPIMVVMGNPPYSRHSANRGRWIGDLVRDYYHVDGKPLGERNPKWLQNDYVKFLRFGQWRIERTGRGVLALITSHGYLDDPTFRGVRNSIEKSFSDVYVLDLHGNQNKQEIAPGGGRDENVFDIRQGVAIGIFVRDDKETRRPATVRHADLWGSQHDKYRWLESSDLTSTSWQELPASAPSYLFIPMDLRREPEWKSAWSVTDIFGVYASTVTTARNDFAIAFDEDTLVRRIRDLKDASMPDDDLRKRYGLRDVSYWTLASARRELRGVPDIGEFVRGYCYRPFDFRFVYYHPAICERLRPEVMMHMRHDNLALLTHRPHSSPAEFTFVYTTRKFGDQCVAANKSVGGGNSYQFPLYVYRDAITTQRQGMLGFDGGHEGHADRSANLSPDFIGGLEKQLGMAAVVDGRGDRATTFGPEDVFDYVYAVLHSPGYRERYEQFLKIDFARVPLTRNPDLFWQLVRKGAELVAVNLMESPLLDEVVATFPVKGSNGWS